MKNKELIWEFLGFQDPVTKEFYPEIPPEKEEIIIKAMADMINKSISLQKAE